MIQFVFGLVLGVYLGLAAARYWRRSGRAIRLVKRDFRPGVAIASPPPMTDAEKASRWTRRYILFAEILARESGKPAHQLPSRADFEKVGIGWRVPEWNNLVWFTTAN